MEMKWYIFLSGLNICTYIAYEATIYCRLSFFSVIVRFFTFAQNTEMKQWLFFICIIISKAHAQKIDVVGEKAGISFRGLCVVSEKIVWVSGSKGTVGRTTDGGTTWNWMTVPGYADKDFRDIE